MNGVRFKGQNILAGAAVITGTNLFTYALTRYQTNHLVTKNAWNGVSRVLEEFKIIPASELAVLDSLHQKNTFKGHLRAAITLASGVKYWGNDARPLMSLGLLLTVLSGLLALAAIGHHGARLKPDD